MAVRASSIARLMLFGWRAVCFLGLLSKSAAMHVWDTVYMGIWRRLFSFPKLSSRKRKLITKFL
jgi:hypothetical protein